MIIKHNQESTKEQTKQEERTIRKKERENVKCKNSRLDVCMKFNHSNPFVY